MAGYQDRLDAFAEADVRVVALSADGGEDARSTKRDEGLGVPVLYGLDVDEMRERLGLYVHKNDRTHLQPAQFILDPRGAVRLACYSSGAVGRLKADEALDQIRGLRGHD